MQTLQVGQCWYSQNEPDLGLGFVIDFGDRTLTLKFPLTDETRCYRIETPLQRVQFKAGETIERQDGIRATVEEVETLDGLFRYHAHIEGEALIINEIELAAHQRPHNPLQQLLSGHLDDHRSFSLKLATQQALSRASKHSASGFLGARTTLLEHQLHIAKQVTDRVHPRVLLSDEVGLGKTIEAGLILHRLLLEESVQRVLIVTPDALVYQWWLELYRRFNLRFKVYDPEHWDADDQDAINDSPLLIVGIQSTLQNHNVRDSIDQNDWDCLVVDEAHHLHWSPENSSVEYDWIAELSQRIEGLLLLSATPQQLGVSGHFARLHLLDSRRFPSLDHFIEEQHQFTKIAELGKRLLSDEAITDDIIDSLNTLQIDHELTAKQSADEAARKSILDQLIDCHGPSRVIFRNTRQAIQGFPKRKVTPHALAFPEPYRLIEPSLIEEELHTASGLAYEHRLPVNTYWVDMDPRVDWLLSLVKQYRHEKLLCISSSRESACALEEHFRLRHGVRCAVFHEGLSLGERDRAAQYFAESDGAQLLICSEIGGEGRNFQFAHHLVLFDLPLNAERLEQRIGRLDRIGQQNDVHIHAPYFEGSAQQRLFEWYHQALNAFEQPCAVAGDLPEALLEARQEYLLVHNSESAASFLKKSIETIETLRNKISQGRDQLAEWYAKGQGQSKQLITDIEDSEANNELPAYLESLFDFLGVDIEDHSEHTWIIRPGAHMRIESLPALPEDGITATWDRDIAVTRDTFQFLSWEHPLVVNAMDVLSDPSIGAASIAILKSQQLPEGTVLLETLHRLRVFAPKHYRLNQFFKEDTIRCLMVLPNKNIAKAISNEALSSKLQPIPKKAMPAFLQYHTDTLKKLSAQADQTAAAVGQEQIAIAREAWQSRLRDEIRRTEKLIQQNAVVHDHTLKSLHEKLESGLSYIDEAQMQLDSVRALITSK